jgi:hypothetical protein
MEGKTHQRLYWCVKQQKHPQINSMIGAKEIYNERQKAKTGTTTLSALLRREIRIVFLFVSGNRTRKKTYLREMMSCLTS